MVVIGLGKLGGRELGYHSDLDLLFLYSGPGETDGARRASNHEHFARVAQRLISHLTLPLREGSLYRIDTRLRPSGSAGPLVVSFDALATYHAREARLWERQAPPPPPAPPGGAAAVARAPRAARGPRPLPRARPPGAARRPLPIPQRQEREPAA